MNFTLIKKTIKDNSSLVDRKCILLTFDDNYLNQTLNLMHSIVRHNNCIGFVCLCPELKEETKNYLFHEAPDTSLLLYEYALDLFTLSSHWPNVTCFRIFSPWLIDDENIEYCVYMYSDILCTGNIESLFKEQNLISMCNELSGNAIVLHESEIGTHIYCNAGVMGFNLKELRKAYTFEQLRDAFLASLRNYHFPDQDFFNVYFRQQLCIWNGLHYNLQVYEVKGSYFYHECLRNCKLIHFAGAKPWTTNAPLFLIRLYKKYSCYTPFKNRLAWLPFKRIIKFPWIAIRVLLNRITIKFC